MTSTEIETIVKKSNIGATDQPQLIGRRKYEILKKFNLEDLTEQTTIDFKTYFKYLTISDALKLIATYEAENPHILQSCESVKAYADKLLQTPKPRETKEMTKQWLWDRFRVNFKANENVNFINNTITQENIKPLFNYFLGDIEAFSKCSAVRCDAKKGSVPSLNKGLLIIGNYGTGKTAAMLALEKSLQDTNIPFRSKSANDVVASYEACDKAIDKDYFWKSITPGTLYFDDLLTERMASNYGTINIFKDVLETRYHSKKKTYATINYDPMFPNDLEKALRQFGKKYGPRVYDRVDAMFNIIEFRR
jgi:DNA replication protein DnaC